jgi:hypothetical protein
MMRASAGGGEGGGSAAEGADGESGKGLQGWEASKSKKRRHERCVVRAGRPVTQLINSIRQRGALVSEPRLAFLLLLWMLVPVLRFLFSTEFRRQALPDQQELVDEHTQKPTQLQASLGRNINFLEMLRYFGHILLPKSIGMSSRRGAGKRNVTGRGARSGASGGGGVQPAAA